MSSLNLPALTGGQANPETTSNDADEQLANALTRTKTIDLTSDATVTAADYRANIRILVTPAGVAKTLTLQAIARLMLIQNDGGNSITVELGTESFVLADNASTLVYTDGTANGLVQLSLGGGGGGPVDYDVSVFVPGIPVASQVLFRLKVIRDFSWPSGLTNSLFDSTAAATASYTATIKNNGSSIGTLVWAIAGTVPTVTFASQVDFVVTDIITVEGAATPDATIKGITLSFAGTKA